jgi:hypothetical protein
MNGKELSAKREWTFVKYPVSAVGSKESVPPERVEGGLPVIAGGVDVILGLEWQTPEKPARSIILTTWKGHGAPGPLRRAGREPVEESDVVLADRGIIEQAEERSRDAIEDAGPRSLVVAGIRADRGLVIESLDDHAVLGGEDVHVIPAAVVERG